MRSGPLSSTNEASAIRCVVEGRSRNLIQHGEGEVVVREKGEKEPTKHGAFPREASLIPLVAVFVVLRFTPGRGREGLVSRQIEEA